MPLTRSTPCLSPQPPPTSFSKALFNPVTNPHIPFKLRSSCWRFLGFLHPATETIVNCTSLVRFWFLATSFLSTFTFILDVGMYICLYHRFNYPVLFINHVYAHNNKSCFIFFP
ncbi:hypothetical protein CPB83DRAFT_116023 [Crepidotus variabilis]|uniref:Uncharacterized protein n=1 Tax=Crepidotus variabilis TaxID=179855 RepID=A0A9P6E4B7_9AGAR|nr:hypothetical protein CPB83DRAFT_116023 [Crepidotus variabilis]